jgi:hypothetical protein
MIHRIAAAFFEPTNFSRLESGRERKPSLRTGAAFRLWSECCAPRDQARGAHTTIDGVKCRYVHSPPDLNPSAICGLIDARLDRQQKLTGRCFNKLTSFRRISANYGKTA